MSPMIRTALIVAVLILLSGCANKRGISATYYNDCREYYDLQGYYHKVCDENLIDYKEAGEALDNTFSDKPVDLDRKVW